MVIFIAGPLGSGKTTTAQELKRRIKRAALVEPDRIREFIEEVPIERAVPIVLAITAQVVKMLSKKGCTVLVPYPLSNKNYRYLNLRLRGVRKCYFVLSPRQATIARGRGKRKLNAWEKSRIAHHYEKGLHDPGFGCKIDNTDLSSRKTAEVILRAIGR